MAFSYKSFALLILLTLLCSLQIHARDSQFFNKVPSSNNNNNIPKQTELPYGEPLSKQEQEPSFIPQTENGGYGLYGHESGQLPPTRTSNNGESGQRTSTKVNVPYKADSKTEVPFDKDLPDNYNTEAYVTKPRGTSDASFMDTSYTTNSNNYYNGANNYNGESGQRTSTKVNVPYKADSESVVPYDKDLPDNYNTEAYVTKPQGTSDTSFMDTSYTTSSNNNNFYNDADNYNSQQAGFSGTSHNDRSYTTPNDNNYYNGDKYYNNQQAGTSSNYYNAKNNHMFNNQKHGMSDTRFLENGKYFYDIKTEKYSRNAHENSRINEYNNNRGTYGNNGNSYGYNNAMDEFQNQDEFQDIQDEDMP